MSMARVEEKNSSSSMRKKQQIQKFCPKGLRVLAVDDNPFCLAHLDRMLQQLEYHVTICTRVSQAMSLLNENRGRFDIVMSEVYLPEEDGFKLLEAVGLGLDLPVILMSANGETSVVMRGITHGACDYLIKPIRMEELRNIWQHVVRRNQEHHCNSFLLPWDDSLGESSDGGRTVDSVECSSKKRRKDEAQHKENDTGQVIQDITCYKKARVHWTVQLHQQFVKAVNQLQIDKAVPKKILEIMKVQGLTRENVASHLQKYRLYLRRLSGIIPEPRPVASFQAAGDGKAGGTMHIRQGGRHQQLQEDEHQCLSPSAALKSLNLGGAAKAISTGRSGIDKATLISLQQYRAYVQRRAAEQARGSEQENPAQPDSKGDLCFDPRRKPRRQAGGGGKKCWPSVDAPSQGLNSSNMAVKMEDMDSLPVGLCTKSQCSSPSFTASNRKATAFEEEKESDKFSSWNEAEDLFVDKFVHEYELSHLTVAAVAAQDFMCSTSAAADLSDYFLDDLLAQPK